MNTSVIYIITLRMYNAHIFYELSSLDKILYYEKIYIFTSF